MSFSIRCRLWANRQSVRWFPSLQHIFNQSFGRNGVRVSRILHPQESKISTIDAKWNSHTSQPSQTPTAIPVMQCVRATRIECECLEDSGDEQNAIIIFPYSHRHRLCANARHDILLMQCQLVLITTFFHRNFGAIPVCRAGIRRVRTYTRFRSIWAESNRFSMDLRWQKMFVIGNYMRLLDLWDRRRGKSFHRKPVNALTIK